MDQELFKCKPAIMRAFQAAKGVHKVIAGHASLCLAVYEEYFPVHFIFPYLTPLIREVAKRTTTT
jgi:hypothetical protein